MNTPKELIVYRSQNGKMPFYDWLHSVPDHTTRAIIRNRIDRLYLGNFGDSKLLSGGFFELRIHYGPGFRVYYGLSGNRLVVLLCGGDKSDQQRDIDKARNYWEDFKNRHDSTPFC